LIDAARIWRALRAASAKPPARLEIDLARASLVDGAIMAFLIELRSSLHDRGIQSEIVGANAQLCSVVNLYAGDERSTLTKSPPRRDPITLFGAALAELGRRAHHVLSFTGEWLASIGGALRKQGGVNWRSLPRLIVRAGADGLVIVVLLNFLIGFVVAYQSMRQLRLYGANVFVADIVGLSVTRELAPLITAVIITGRSGAAYAAELGTMRVTEELDALRTMGFSPVSYLVVPRVFALALVAPLLTLLGDVVGVLGGLVVGTTSLGLSARGFISELRTIVIPSDVWTGIIKSFTFGIGIALIGCEQGISTRGSASGVGRSTTATVVYCLFTIVILDTLLTVIFREYGV
jgi:phospholipid/cholesterol/gamma-HCH transport system permease protein